MNFTIEKRNLQDFYGIPYGTLFLDERNVPYIKIPEVAHCEYGYVYNSICLATGEGENFREDKKVNVPNDYKLKISI